jgi:hypothetical protein
VRHFPLHAVEAAAFGPSPEAMRASLALPTARARRCCASAHQTRLRLRELLLQLAQRGLQVFYLRLLVETCCVKFSQSSR